MDFVNGFLSSEFAQFVDVCNCACYISLCQYKCNAENSFNVFQLPKSVEIRVCVCLSLNTRERRL